MATGAFDDPAALAAWIQYGIEGRLPFVDGLAALPARLTDEDQASAAFLSGVVSRQHPDHDTSAWPPAVAGAVPDPRRGPGAAT